MIGRKGGRREGEVGEWDGRVGRGRQRRETGRDRPQSPPAVLSPSGCMPLTSQARIPAEHNLELVTQLKAAK